MKEERRLVSRHLGGSREQRDESKGVSGNYTRLGRREARSIEEDSSRSEDFIPRQSTGYDPLKMIRNKAAGIFKIKQC